MIPLPHPVPEYRVMSRMRSLDLSSARSVTALMARFNQSARANALPVMESPPVVAGEELTTLQKLALLQMLEFKGNTRMPSSLVRGIARLIQSEDDCQAKFSMSDFHVLADMGYAARTHGATYHHLTPLGEFTAERIVKDLCAARGIHYRVVGDSGSVTINNRCLCGQWSIGVDKIKGAARAEASGLRFYAQHIAKANGAKHQDEAVGGVTLLTDHEARTRWCPMARTYGYEGSSPNRQGPAGLDEGKPRAGTLCIASDCMMWRWRMKAIFGDAGAHRGWQQTDQGFCGLAGVPPS